MKKTFVVLMLLLFACPSFAFDSERCRLVSEATWEHYGYQVDVICAQDRVELILRKAPVMQDPKDLARFIGFICGWGRALHNEHHMEYRTRMIIKIDDRSMETTVGNCVRTTTKEGLEEFFLELLSSWR